MFVGIVVTLVVMLNTQETFTHLGFTGSAYAKMEGNGSLIADDERGDLFLTLESSFKPNEEQPKHEESLSETDLTPEGKL